MKKLFANTTFPTKLLLAAGALLALPVTGMQAQPAAAAGDDHTLIVQSDGDLFAWGRNNFGQIGDRSRTNRSTPVQAAGDWVAVSGGSSHTLAVDSQGRLYAWGREEEGQLGLGTGLTDPIDEPTQVGTLSAWSDVAAGQYHSLALQADGSLWAFGSNNSGQLGLGGTLGITHTPTEVTPGQTYQNITAGDTYSLAVRTGHCGPLAPICAVVSDWAKAFSLPIRQPKWGQRVTGHRLPLGQDMFLL